MNPLVFFAKYMLWKVDRMKPANHKSKGKKFERLLAIDALMSLRLFPECTGVLVADDDEDRKVTPG